MHSGSYSVSQPSACQCTFLSESDIRSVPLKLLVNPLRLRIDNTIKFFTAVMGILGVMSPVGLVCLLVYALACVTFAAGEGVTRFVVIAEPRTGSTLLVDSLNEHPKILAHREVLRYDNWDMHAFRDTIRHRLLPGWSFDARKELQSNLKRNSTFYINHIFDTRDDEEAVGFKMFHWHLRWKESLKVLRDPDVKKIVLFRRSLLAKITSHQVAGYTGSFHGRVTHEHIDLDIERAVESAETSLTWYSCVKDALADQEYAMVAYEELDSRFQTAMHRLTNFLGVSPDFTYTQAQRKQTVQPLEETAKNADEVAAKFTQLGIPDNFDFLSNPRHYNEAQCRMLLKQKA